MKVKNQIKKICKCFDITTIKFILVGIVNTIVGTGVMFFLYNFCSVNYWIASASNYIVGSIVSYFLNKYFTFKNTEHSTRQIVKFIINISVCYFIAYGVARPVVETLLPGAREKAGGNIAMLVGMSLFVILNYFGQRFYVFRK